MKPLSASIAAFLMISACGQSENAASDVGAEVTQIAGSFEAALAPALAACTSYLADGSENREALAAIGARNAPLSSNLTIPYTGTYKSGLFSLPNRIGIAFVTGDERRGCGISTYSTPDGTRLPILVLGYLQSIGYSIEPQERRGIRTARRGDEDITVSFVRESSPVSSSVTYSANLRASPR